MTGEFREINGKVNRAIVEDGGLARVVRECVFDYMKGRPIDGNNEVRMWEKKYISEEMSMSILVTEKVGYNLELWEKPVIMMRWDPLAYVYESRRELVKRVVGKDTLRRYLEYIVT